MCSITYSCKDSLDSAKDEIFVLVSRKVCGVVVVCSKVGCSHSFLVPSLVEVHPRPELIICADRALYIHLLSLSLSLSCALREKSKRERERAADIPSLSPPNSLEYLYRSYNYH